MAESIGDIDVTGWPEPDKAALRAALTKRAEAEAALTTAQAARDSAARSPAAIIAEQMEAARVLVRRAQAEAELEKARVTYGRKRALLVPTGDGGIVLRAMTLAETDTAELRAAELKGPERIAIHRDALLDSVVWPDRAAVQERASAFPALWGTLYAARDYLISDVEEEHLGKAGASTAKPAAT